MSSIVTFYSFKGGVGRTMALANIAILLAHMGKRVLAVDWDLEAPGLDRYFQNYKIDDKNDGVGLLDLLIDYQKTASQNKKINWRNYISYVDIGGGYSFSLLTSGRQDENYAQKVLDFDWHLFFSESDGGNYIESLREDWRDDYDVVLIDSRTGITDSSGICTIQLPDILIPVFTSNEQSFQGAKDIALRAQKARQNLAFDRMPLLVFPLPSRFDSRTEFEEAQEWLKIFAKELAPFYNDWLPKPLIPLQIIERTKLPYIAYFSFGEKLPVVSQGISDPEGLGYAYLSAANLIANDFKNAHQLISKDPPNINLGENTVNIGYWSVRRKISLLFYLVFFAIDAWASAESLSRSLLQPKVFCYILAINILILASFCLNLIFKSLSKNYVANRAIKLISGSVAFTIASVIILMTITHNIYYVMSVDGLRQNELRNVRNQLGLIKDDTFVALDRAKTRFSGDIEADIANLKIELLNPNNRGHGESSGKIINTIEQKLGTEIEMPSKPPSTPNGMKQYTSDLSEQIREITKRKLWIVDDKTNQLSDFIEKEGYQNTQKRLDSLIDDYYSKSETEIIQGLRDSYSLYDKTQKYIKQIYEDPLIKENANLSVESLPEVPVSIRLQDVGYTWGEFFKRENVNTSQFLWAILISLTFNLSWCLFLYFGVFPEQD